MTHLLGGGNLINKKLQEEWFVESLSHASGYPKNVSFKSEVLVLLTLLSQPLFFWTTFCTMFMAQNGVQKNRDLLNKVGRASAYDLNEAFFGYPEAWERHSTNNIACSFLFINLPPYGRCDEA